MKKILVPTPRVFKALIMLFAALTLSACATFNLQPPQLTLLEIAPVSAGTRGLDLSFNIRLRVANPNAIPLPIKGMSYTLALNGADVLQGVSNNIPRIAAYGSEEVTLTIGTNLLSAPKFLLGLLRKPNQEIRYELQSKIDLDGPFPTFNVVETGLVPVK